jgi:hypothetical protein
LAPLGGLVGSELVSVAVAEEVGAINLERVSKGEDRNNRGSERTERKRKETCAYTTMCG